MKYFIGLICMLLMGVGTVNATLWVDDYLAVNDGDVYDGEVFLTGDGVIDIFGGSIGKLETLSSSEANLYDGDIKWLTLRNTSNINIHGGMIGEGAISAYDSSTVFLYATDVTFHPSDEYGESMVEGTYISNSESFMLPVWHVDTFAHINIVPEPASLVLFGLGGMLVRKTQIL